jgi:hypothetical protein
MELRIAQRGARHREFAWAQDALQEIVPFFIIVPDVPR